MTTRIERERLGVYLLRVTPAQARVLAVVFLLHAEYGRVTVREVGLELGLRSSSTVWFHLIALKHAGLVKWETGRAGTLRPAFSVHAPSSTDA